MNLDTAKEAIELHGGEAVHPRLRVDDVCAIARSCEQREGATRQ